MALARSIGRFEIEAEAAAGAAGTVYRAVDRSNGVRVAMKVLRGLARADTARFSREARILAQIEHPGVVRYIDHGVTDEGNAYLVMEWLDGEDVRRRLVRTGLSMGESVALGLRVAEALVAVHEQGLVHRDIKPANIFLPSGLVAEAKIIDFGLVHTAWASMEVTKTGMVVGTPSYMAPEQARGQRAIDPRADIFSLGCVLYRCLAGRAPFEGKSVLAVLTKVLLEDAPPLHTLRADVPADLEQLVMRMLRKDPAERPPTAAATAAALAALAPVGGPDDFIEPAAPSHVLAGLTAGEQRVAAVVLIGADATMLGDPSPPADATLPAGGDDEGAARPHAGPDLRSVVEQNGGELDFLFDGTRVVTIADASVATDEAARAARCALAVRAALPRVPIAIATGRKHVGFGEPSGNAIERAAQLLGAVSRGDSVRPPARRSSRPPAAGIAIDEVTAALLDARFDVVHAGGEHRLLGVRVVETAARTLLGKVTPMVGREWELRTIRSMFRTVVEEREARSVLVTGAPGMGKSRLAHEAVTTLRDDYPDAEVWTGRGDPLRASSALGLLGNILHSAAGIHESDPIEARRARFAERVEALVPAGDAAWMASVLGEVAGVPFPEEEASQGRRDARLVTEQIRAAWEALVAGACRGWPLLLVLEDLQWADTATIRLLGTALVNLERHPWGVLALARPEVHDTFPRLWNAQNLQEIRLAPLTRRAGERLVRETLGDTVGVDTVERIAAQADGNAFYLEELIRRYHDGGGSKPPQHPPGHDGGGPGPPPNPPGLSPVSPGGDLHGGALPETVLAMVQARLEGLDAGTRRLLRAASIFGEVFWGGGVTALLGGSEPQAGWIELLVRRELVVIQPESRFAGERDLAFRHALLREGAYAMLTPGDRALGHALAAAWLEQKGEPDAMVLATHFEIGRDALRAGELYRAAAEQALRVANFDAAVRRAKQALAHAEKEPAVDRLACLDVLCEAHVWRGDSAEIAACIEAILPLAPRGSEPWLRALGRKQAAAITLSQPAQVREVIDALVQVEAAPGTEGALVPQLMTAVLWLALGARHPEAASVLARMEAVVAAAPATDRLVLQGALELARAWVAGWGRGDPWTALREARAKRDRGAPSADARHTRYHQPFIAESQLALGLYPEAEAELRSLGPIEGDDVVTSRQELYLALVLIARGAVGEARALAEHRITAGEARADTLGATRAAEGRWLLGEAAAHAGDLESAERDLAACLPPLAASTLLWQMAAARLCEVRLARGQVSEALSLDRELQRSMLASGGPGPRGALIQLVHAEILEASGEHAAALEALRAAWDDLQARAARIDDPTVRRRFLEDVPENARTVTRAREWLGVEG